MKRARWVICAWLAVVACKSKDTYQGVFVEVRNPANVAGIVGLHVYASNGIMREEHVFPAGGPAGLLDFAASFSFTIPPNRGGEVDIAVDALNASDEVVANGAGFAVLEPDTFQTIVVDLLPGASLCGNGRLDPGEPCDDGDRYSGNGCSYLCQRENPPDAAAGTGGTVSGTGGSSVTGAGGQLGTGGIISSTGGRSADAGVGGVGGSVGRGGATGSAGRDGVGGLIGVGGGGAGAATGRGGTTGVGGTMGSGGAGTGGIRGSGGGVGGGVSGTGGTTAAGTGGSRGTGGTVSSTGGSTGTSPVDCQAAMPSGGTEHCGQNTSGTAGGQSWSLWCNGLSSSACMTTFSTPAFSARWNSNSDFLARLGLEFGSAGKTYDQYGTLKADFTFTKSGSGGGYSYIGVYGWTNNPCVEWYIVDDKFGTMPFNAYNATLKGSATIDGEAYNLFQNKTRGTGGSRCSGVTEWDQYWSIRQTARQCGTITMTKHFRAWETAGLPLGSLLEAKILVETGGGTGSIDFPIAKVTAE